jgi:hypothetical protein
MPASRMPRVVAAKLLIHGSHHAHNHKINQWISWTSSPPLTLTWERYHPSFYIRVVISWEGWQVLSCSHDLHRQNGTAWWQWQIATSISATLCIPLYPFRILLSWKEHGILFHSRHPGVVRACDGRLVLRSTVAHLFTMTIEMRHFPSYSAYDYVIHYLAGQHRYD